MFLKTRTLINYELSIKRKTSIIKEFEHLQLKYKNDIICLWH